MNETPSNARNANDNQSGQPMRTADSDRATKLLGHIN